MGQEPEELRRDIASRRSEMADTIDAIEDRVSPGRVVERRQEAVKSRVRGWRERVMGSPDDDVYVATAYGSPAGPVAGYGTYEGTYETTSLAPDMPAAGDQSPSAKDKVRDQASGMAGEAKDRVSGVAHAAGDQARHAPEMAQQKAKGNPLAAGLVAFGAGLVAAAVIPESRTERRAVSQVQPQLDHLAEEAGHMGQDVAQSAKSTAQEEAEGLKESAKDRAQDVKGHAQESGQQVKGEAQQAGQDVKNQTQGS